MRAVTCSEDSFVSSLLRPLTEGKAEAAGFCDDVALVPFPAKKKRQVVSTDSIIAGIHCFGDEPADMLATKLLRRACSDLAAKAASPVFYTLNLAVSASLVRSGGDMSWIERFVEGLAREQKYYGAFVLGGDTVILPSDAQPQFVISATVFGEITAKRWPRRDRALAGDNLFVTGHIGGSAYGLDLLREENRWIAAGVEPKPRSGEQRALITRYRTPPSRLELMKLLAERFPINAAIDVSDGFLIDLERLASASKVRAEVDVFSLPLQHLVQRRVHSKWPTILSGESDICEKHRDGLLELCAAIDGGDDYEVIFSCGSDVSIDEVETAGNVLLASRGNYPGCVSCIGRLVEEETVSDHKDHKEGKRSDLVTGDHSADGEYDSECVETSPDANGASFQHVEKGIKTNTGAGQHSGVSSNRTRLFFPDRRICADSDWSDVPNFAPPLGGYDHFSRVARKI